MMPAGISQRSVRDTPVAVIDFETTGLTAGYDRVVEVSVIRIDPGAEPVVMFDSLINPGRRVAATEVHGITDADVQDAPTFAEVAGEIRDGLSGCMIAAYNVYFEVNFMNHEFTAAGQPVQPPYMCLMYLRPMLGLGKRCCLAEACRAHNIAFEHAHASAHDAMAAARLFRAYLDAMQSQGVRTFGDLARLRSYKFVESFDREPCTCCDPPSPRGRRKSRSIRVTGPPPQDVAVPIQQVVPNSLPCCAGESRGGGAHLAIREYWDTLKTAIADLEITDAEIDLLSETRRRLALEKEQIRALHARAFMNVLAHFTADARLDNKESRTLQRVLVCLSRAGWAPGE